MPVRILISLHTLGVLLLDRAITTWGRRRDDRGSVSLDQVLWAVGVLAIAAIAIGGITVLVKNQLAKAGGGS